MDNRAITLFDCRDNLQHEICEQLGLAGIVSFAQTSPSAFCFFKSEYKSATSVIKKAFTHAIRGEWDDVDNLLKLFPDLLRCRFTIYDPGRFKYVDRYLWQIALMNDEGDNLFTMFKKHFERLPNGFAELVSQYDEIFPDGKIIKYGWNFAHAKKLVDDLFILISDKAYRTRKTNVTEKLNIVTNEPLQTFYDYVTPKASEHFQKGLTVDTRLFLYVLKKYKDNYFNLNCAQREFYGTHVWDYLMTRLSTGYLRALCQGLAQIQDQKEPLSVNGCRLRTEDGIGTGASILPLNSDQQFVLGEHMINYYGQREYVIAAHAAVTLCVIQRFEKLFEEKKITIENFKDEIRSLDKKSCCVIL